MTTATDLRRPIDLFPADAYDVIRAVVSGDYAAIDDHGLTVHDVDAIYRAAADAGILTTTVDGHDSLGLGVAFSGAPTFGEHLADVAAKTAPPSPAARLERTEANA